MCQPQIVQAIASNRMKKEKSIYDYRIRLSFSPFALITFQQMIESARYCTNVYLCYAQNQINFLSLCARD